MAGASSGFDRGGGGVQEIFFFGFGNLLVTGEAMRFAGGVQGHAPPPDFF